MVTESSPSPAGNPIVVAVSASRRCSETLEMAAALATSVGADLEVMLVEDENLARLADLPVTREVDRVSGTTRELDSARLQRALQGEARQLRHELTRIRRTTSIRSTVRVVRGQILSEAMAASTSVDVTFVHDPRRTPPGEHLQRALLRRETAFSVRGSARYRGRRAVWALFESGPASVRALRVAATLSGALGSRLMVLVPQRGAEETESARREARAAVDQLEMHFVEVAENRSLLQERILARGAGSLLVLAKQSRELEDQETRDYLESLGVPLVLVT